MEDVERLLGQDAEKGQFSVWETGGWIAYTMGAIKQISNNNVKLLSYKSTG